jgi:hypothetical protein
MPRQSFVHTAVALAPVERVWLELQRPEVWGQISGVTKLDSASFDDRGDLTGYRFNAVVAGGDHPGTATRAANVPGRHMVMEIDSEQLSGTIAVDLEPLGWQTAVTVDMTIGSKGFTSALLFPVISAAVASGFNETVERFVARLEN